MEVKSLEFYQQKSKKILSAAAYFQSIAIVTVGSIIYFKPSNYKELGLKLSLAALFLSFVISRLYINNGKKLEAIKSFSNEERRNVARDYAFWLFLPYVLWGICASCCR